MTECDLYANANIALKLEEYSFNLASMQYPSIFENNNSEVNPNNQTANLRKFNQYTKRHMQSNSKLNTPEPLGFEQ